MKIKSIAAAVALGLGISFSAHSALIVQDGTGGSIPQPGVVNDILGPASEAAPYGFGANLYSVGTTTVLFEFLGFEAGFDNEFYVNNNLVFSNNGPNSTGSSFIATFGNGALNFSFWSPLNGGSSSVNGSNPSNTSLVNFFVATSSNNFSGDLFLAFDDDGNDNDDNHDDMVIRVSQVEVPEPGTLALLGLGLVGLGIARKRKV